jgi:hypothetical protein
MELVLDESNPNHDTSMKTFFTTLVMTIVFCTSSITAQIWQGYAAASFNGGTGTAEDPFQIANAEQLAFLAKCVNDTDTWDNYSNGKYFILTADIFLNDSLMANSDTVRTGSFLEWTPIGLERPNGNHHFRGTFDGNGHVISGLFIDRSDPFNGLFGFTQGASIRNLTIVDSYVKGGDYTGSLIGYADGCSLKHLTNKARVRGTTENTGGIVGFTEYASSIDSCSNDGQVSSMAGAGGIAGRIHNNTPISNSINRGKVEGLFRVGGIVGATFYNSSLTSCINEGIIISTDDPSVGGIAGYSEGSLTKCTNRGSVTGSNNDAQGENLAGGLVGRHAGTCTIDHCSNEALVKFTNVSNASGTCEASVGGIVGFLDNGSTTIKNCFNSWSIISESGRNFTGGICGRITIYSHSSVSSCHNLGSIRQIDTNTGNDDMAGGIVGYAQRTTITNCVNDSSIVGVGFTGGIGGFVDYESTTLTCTNNGIIKGRNATGGIAGGAYGAGIDSCINYGTIQGLSTAGGIVGENREYGVTKNCINYAEVTSLDDPRIGGIAGSNASSMSNCKNLGLITGYNNDNQGDNSVGGIIGLQYGTVTISRCYNGNKLSFLPDGKNGVCAFSKLGGIIGMLTARSCVIRDCSNEGEIVNESDNSHMGGILGYSNYDPYDNGNIETLTNCSNSGRIIQRSQTKENEGYIGGLVGVGHTRMQNCVNTGFIQGRNNVGVLMGANYNCYITSVGITNSFGFKSNETNTPWHLVANNQGSINGCAFFNKHQQLTTLVTLDSTRYTTLKPILEKWIAVNDSTLLGWNDYYDEYSHTSLPTLGAYHCAQPIITVENGTLSIQSTTANSTVLYTVDGTEPLLSTTAQTYHGSTSLSAFCPIKAVATATDFAPSPVSVFNYGLSVCEPPVISIDSCTVTITDATPGATIFYTLDGSDPQKAGQLYTEPFNLFNTTTIKTYARLDSLFESNLIDTTFNHPLLWDGSMADSFAGGSGTEADPYLIATAPQLKRLSYYTYYYENWTSGKYFKLIDDIVLNTFYWPTYVANGIYELNVWEPIGNGDGSGLYDFKGIFDGDGHTIYGVYHDLKTAYYLGLFGATNGAIIKNVTVDEAYLHGYSYIGGLVGKAVSSTFTNVLFNGPLLAESDFTGGLTGHGISLVIDKGKTSGILKGASFNGGIAGYLQDAAISNCQSNDSIRGASNHTGGISGYITKTSLTNCVNTGEVYGENVYVAGIAAYSVDASINGCTNYGAISVRNDGVAGIVAFNGVNSPISQCTNYGSIYNYPENSNWNNGAAGIVQLNKSNISRCVNHGSVTASTGASGIVCSNDYYDDSFIIDHCSNYGTIVGVDNNAAGILAHRRVTNISFEIIDCHNFGPVSSNGNDVGGIVGTQGGSSSRLRIINCLNMGDIKGNDNIGGLCGSVYDAWGYGFLLQNSFNGGRIHGNNIVGGLIGAFEHKLSSTFYVISSCYNSGDINATGIKVGGLCGYIGLTTLSNAYNTGNVTSSTTSGIGGLVGYMVDNSQLSNAYNTGKVSGVTEDGITNGAIVGFIQNGCQVKYGHSLRNDSVNLNLELYGVNEGTSAYLRGFDNDQLFEIGVQYNDSVYCDNLLSLLNTWSLYNQSPEWIVTADNGGFPIIANFKCATPSITESDYYYSIVTTTPGAIIYYTTNGSDPLHYGSVYEKPFTASNDGLIKTIAVCEGYFNSELATYDCSLTGVMLGDANNDRAVRPSDVVTTVNYILGNQPSPFLFRAADINNNGEITTSDVVNIVRIILGTYTDGKSNIARLRNATLRSTDLPVLALTSGEVSTDGDATLNVSMENSASYSAIQFDLELPEGISLSDVVLSDTRFTASHVKAWNKLSSNRVRVVIYSASNGSIGETTGALLSLILKADQRVQTGTHTITMDNIYLTDAAGLDVKPAPINGLLMIGETTGFGQPKQDFRIISGKNLIIISPANMVVNIYAIDGHLVRMVELFEGSNIIRDLPKGIYLINKQKAVVR